MVTSDYTGARMQLYFTASAVHEINLYMLICDGYIHSDIHNYVNHIQCLYKQATSTHNSHWQHPKGDSYKIWVTCNDLPGRVEEWYIP